MRNILNKSDRFLSLEEIISIMKRLIILLVLMIIIITSGCIRQKVTNGDEKTTTTDELYCQSKSDCVPATCCHSDSCVNKNFKPDCTNIGCTAECEPGTMDCGQGYCDCVDNECKAIVETF